MIKAYPKIFSIGTDYVKSIFDGPVEVTEKIDGCVALGTKILTADLKYINVEFLKIGDEIIGFDENLNRSKFQKSFVLYAKPIRKECVEVFFDNKNSIIVSRDHPFVVRFIKKTNEGLSKKYINASDLQIGDRILSIGMWELEQTWESGYIAGQYDGEGCLVGPSKTHNTRYLSYTQKKGDGADKIEQMLIDRGFCVSKDERKRRENWSIVQTLRIVGGWSEIVRFLGTFRPKRLLRKYFDKIFEGTAMNGVKDVRVVQVKDIGIKSVIGLQTSTKTYISDGLLSHNSQFSFGNINGDIYARSKGAIIYFEKPESLFEEAISYVDQIGHRLPENLIFYCEYLKKPKHNTLKYNRIPKNHLMLFGVMDLSQKFYLDTAKYADLLEIEPIPILYFGLIKNMEQLTEMLDIESVLGGVKLEGIVAKNYKQQFLLGGQPIPVMAGKFVSEKFKEVHGARWGKVVNKKNRVELFLETFCTEARWQKAVQHLLEKGELENQPKDIGKLIKEIQTDIEVEEEQNVKEWLWKEFKGQIARKSIKGFPEWYKKKLVEESFKID